MSETTTKTRKPFTFRGDELPGHLQRSIDAYIASGRPTGGFLRAVIDNNLQQACARADEENVRNIFVIVAYLYNECPMGSWGFTGASEQWIKQKREEREGVNP